MAKSIYTVDIKFTETEVFDKLLDISSEFTKDERINKKIREEYKAKILEIVNNKELYDKKKEIKDINDINTETSEGKLLLACLARLTTEIDTNLTPWECIKKTSKVMNKFK